MEQKNKSYSQLILFPILIVVSIALILFHTLVLHVTFPWIVAVTCAFIVAFITFLYVLFQIYPEESHKVLDAIKAFFVKLGSSIWKGLQIAGLWLIHAPNQIRNKVREVGEKNKAKGIALNPVWAWILIILESLLVLFIGLLIGFTLEKTL